MKPLLRLLLLLPILTLLFVSGASGHSGKQSYVYVSILDRGIDGRIEYPSADLAASLGLQAPADVDGVERFVDENYASIVSYSDEHFAIGDGEREWATEFTGFDVIETETLPYVQIHYRVDESFSAVPRSFTVAYDGIFHANPEKDALIIIEHDFGSATFGNEGTPIAGVSVEQTVQSITLDDVPMVSSLSALTTRGLEAVRYRADVIWFTLVLLAASVLVTVHRSTRKAVPDLGSVLRRFAVLLAIFTGSYSVSLWLGTLGPIDLSGNTASALAAASLAIIGLVVTRTPVAVERVGVALLGLGPGFAVAEMSKVYGIDRSRPLLSMLFFNLGAELALFAVVLLALPALLLLRRTPLAPFAAIGAVVAAGVFAVVILLELLADSTSPLSGVVYSIVRWPRSIGLAIALAVAAGVLNKFFERRQALLAVTNESA